MSLSLEQQVPTSGGHSGAVSTAKPPTSTLLRLAGLAALLAGLCYVFVGILHPSNVSASVTSTRWETVHVVACAMCFFGLLGLVGALRRQATKTGWLGLVGFVLLSLWFVLIMGFSFVEAFILPKLATTDPRFVAAWFGMLIGPATKTNLGALPTLWTLSGPIYIAGGLALVSPRSAPESFHDGRGPCLRLGQLWRPSLLPYPTHLSQRSRYRSASHSSGSALRSVPSGRRSPSSTDGVAPDAATGRARFIRRRSHTTDRREVAALLRRRVSLSCDRASSDCCGPNAGASHLSYGFNHRDSPRRSPHARRRRLR